MIFFGKKRLHGSLFLLKNWIYPGWPSQSVIQVSCPRSTLNSGIKTMIIIIFILMLTRALLLVYSRVGFKTMIRTTFILFANCGQPDSWLGPCSRSNPKLIFKTIIITIFILIYLNWIILELIFLKNILEIKK